MYQPIMVFTDRGTVVTTHLFPVTEVHLTHMQGETLKPENKSFFNARHKYCCN